LPPSSRSLQELWGMSAHTCRLQIRTRQEFLCDHGYAHITWHAISGIAKDVRTKRLSVSIFETGRTDERTGYRDRNVSQAMDDQLFLVDGRPFRGTKLCGIAISLGPNCDQVRNTHILLVSMLQQVLGIGHVASYYIVLCLLCGGGNTTGRSYTGCIAVTTLRVLLR
jgi:hypothetical protein